METHASTADLLRQLPRDACHMVMHTLRGALPPVSETPEDIARRDRDAIARVACLLPVNADEAHLAAEYVAAGAQAMDCIRLARRHGDDISRAMRCTAQAAAMLRQARAMRALLMRVQAERQKRETQSGGLDSSNWTAQFPTGRLVTEALATPAAPAAPAPAATMAAEADRYALAHRKRAALIRSLGRLPDTLNCGPMAPALVHAIVTGASPVLRALDRRPRQSDRLPSPAR